MRGLGGHLAGLFDFRRGFIKELRINEQIRAFEVRLIDDQNEQRGVVKIDEARALATERGLDLVEVAPTAVPPVCRLMDYGKFRFEMAKREKDAKRKQKIAEIKEMKLRPKIGDHDFQTKYRSVHEFLEEGNKVKVTIMFRGREMAHPDIGRALLSRVADQAKEIAIVERPPILEGRNMVMVLSPNVKTAPAQALTAAVSEEQI